MSRIFRVRNRAPRTVALPRSGHHPWDPDMSSLSPNDLLKNAERQAHDIVSRARDEASSMIDSATTQAASIREDAYQEGWSSGRKAGLDETAELLDEARNALQQARDAFESMLHESEPKIVALALDAAKRVASSWVKEEPGVLLDMVRRGIETLKDEKEFAIRVDPSLLPIVDGAKDDLVKDCGARFVEVRGDSQVSNGAIVSTKGGFIDVTIDAQIRNLAEAMKEAREAAGGRQP